MPIEKEIREKLLAYCDKDLPTDNEKLFNFIEDHNLKEKILFEYKSARYIYKLGEALHVQDYRRHSHVKFQIIQYAGIYEAIIVYLLWHKFKDREEVKHIETHSTYKSVGKISKKVTISTIDNKPIELCTKSETKTSIISIKFDDKVDAAEKIGFIDTTIAKEIKEFYKLRNAIHLESAIKNNTKYEIENSLLAYRRILPFTRGIKGFLKSGSLPKNARPKLSATKNQTEN